MLTRKLADALNTVFHDMEISPEIQDTWAAPENRNELVTIIRKLQNGPQEKRGVCAPRPSEVMAIDMDRMRLRSH